MKVGPSTCFETSPFPAPSEPQRLAAAAAGKALNDQRFAVMQKNREGMTKTWNRLHDPTKLQPDIVELRALRDAMDRASLDCYVWSDLQPNDREAIVKRLRVLNAERAAQVAGKA